MPLATRYERTNLFVTLHGSRVCGAFPRVCGARLDVCVMRICVYKMKGQYTIPYIGNEILLLTKNDHRTTQKAPKSIIPEEIKSAGHSPSSDSVIYQDLK